MCTVLLEQKCLPLLSNYEIIHQTYSLFINIYALNPFLETKITTEDSLYFYKRFFKSLLTNRV